MKSYKHKLIRILVLCIIVLTMSVATVAQDANDLPEKYRKYQGHQDFCCPGHAHRFTTIAEHMIPGTIDMLQLEQMVRLVPETADYLYSDYTPLKVNYQKGDRPALECLVEKITKDRKTEREKVVAIAEWIHHELYVKAPAYWSLEKDSVYYYGGSEEEIIRRRSLVCNEISRVFVAMCQVLGVPARMVYVMHVVAEAYIDGRWSLLDFNANLRFHLPDGSIANAWEIVQNDRKLIREHPDYENFTKGYKERHFKVSAICNYFIWEDHPTSEYKIRRVTKKDFYKMVDVINAGVAKNPYCPVLGKLDFSN